MILILTASIMYWSLLQQADESELSIMNDDNVSDTNTETTDGTELSSANKACALAQNEDESPEESLANQSANS